MIELIKFFRILFLSPKITNDRLKAFTEDHIQRLTTHNPGGIFTVILTAITTAYNNYFGDISSESLNKAVQEGKTVAMIESRKALEKNISDNEALVKYTYRANLPFYEEFYPLGLTEYYQADLSTFTTITQRYKEVLAAHAADFPAPFVEEFTALQEVFVVNRNAQLAAKGNVAGERSDIATTRPALAKQLTKNLLTIALQYAGDESKCDVYFDQTILDSAFRESDRKITAEINPGETQSTFDNITKGDLQLRFKNTGEGNLNYGFVQNSTDAIAATAHIVPAGQTITLSAAELGWTTVNKYLNITNNGEMAGSYTIEKI